MGKLITRAEGRDGQIELLSDRVVIHRAGFFNIFKCYSVVNSRR